MSTDKYIKFELIDRLFSDDVSSEFDLKEELLISEALMKLRRLNTQTKAELKRAKFERVENFIQKVKEGLNDDIQKYKDLSQEIFLNPKYAALQPMFSNLKEVTEEDQKSILLDSKYLELIDQLEDSIENSDES